jgi:hypothetical protein
MLASLGKYVGGKVLTALLVVTSAVIVIWFWQLPPEKKEAIWNGLKYSLIWIGFTGVLPWALFFVPPMLVRAESNLVSAAGLMGYLIIDILAALWLAGWHFGGALAWLVVVLGFGCAATYNFVVCEYLAQRAEEM